MSSLQKDVANQNFTFGLVNSSTGAALTGATVTVYVTKDNGTQATGTGTVTEAGNGQYNYAPTQAETDATDVGFLLTATSAIPVNIDFHTDIVDVNGYLSTNIVDINGSAVSTTSAQMGVNIVEVGGSATAATNVSKANQAIGRGTVGSGSSTTTINTSSWSLGGSGVVDSQFLGRTLIFDANTTTTSLQGQATSISDNNSGATPQFTVVALTTAPVAGDTFGVY